VAVDKHRIELAGKTVLVTGGTGTVGSAIVRRLVASEAEGIRILSRDEHKQFELARELPSDPRLRFLIGDTRDLSRMRRATEGAHVVFHAAAMKHVFSCEYNPFEAIRTNILGTQNVIDAALDSGVERMMFASSDKAVNPTSTMGASKLMAEKLITAADAARGAHPTVFTTVRFGNVVGSRGSVIPVFAEQVAAGGPVTLTDRRMTRFVMAIEDAVDLMFRALQLARGGEVFVLKMAALRIEDIAHVLRDRLAERYGHARDAVAIEEVGMRAGEKVWEELLTEEEAQRALETDEMYIVLPQLRSLHGDVDPSVYPGGRPAATAARSDRWPLLTRDEVQALLASHGFLEAA
jgi:FlaA1/EpsC-like NDP-sugar epimerase